MPVTERPKTSDLKVNFGPAEALVIKSLSGSLGAKGKKGACDPFDKQPSDDTTDESSIISTDTPEMDELKPLKSIINSDSSVPTPLRSFDILSFNNSRYETPRFFNDYLSPNSKFSGMQQSSKNKHKIEVEFKHVDLTNSLVVGFLKIQGLSDEHPEITTCFKGEIINNPLKTRYDKSLAKNYSFLTENSQWGSSFTNDLDHWKRLSNYYNLTDDEFSKKLFLINDNEKDQGLVYMRWKEEFLLPDARVKQLNGASFEGFYYIVMNIGNKNKINFPIGSINGLYYFQKSEKFQSLSLSYINDRGLQPSFSFL